VNVTAQNARFVIGTGNSIAEFSGAKNGVAVDRDAVYALLADVLHARTRGNITTTREFTLPVSVVEPEVRTSDVNGLGITEVLGVGYSSFAGSPPTRVKNIRHGAMDKLHGRLIAPGEDFSLVAALKPFTLADGYVPEKVIKGGKIEKEIGGGLCQIGSTLFRAAMNSGLPIVERRSHGLVVSYYNDPRNGNPGTDATIYDPKPDFRFKNDTGRHILISVEMNEKTQELWFSFWGTSDGRKGSYTPPIVKRWIPHGETVIVETTDLPPGKRDCQHAYIGAETAFTYTRTLPNGEKLDEVFESSYRPMPELCLVGVAASSTSFSGEVLLPAP
jgi:vancomycin resistance protein YoaR